MKIEFNVSPIHNTPLVKVHESGATVFLSAKDYKEIGANMNRFCELGMAVLAPEPVVEEEIAEETPAPTSKKKSKKRSWEDWPKRDNLEHGDVS